MAQKFDQSTSGITEKATFGGGCFWCLEAVYDQINGVVEVVSGYSGGKIANPSYEQVCAGTTGHIEVVQITFEPDLVTYKELLWIFFSIHDPTTLDRQGADVGSQYRSAIFPHDVKQNSIAKQVISEIGEADMFGQPVVTQVSFITEFYKAEEYHQNYYKRNPYQTYCQIVIEPKIDKIRKRYLSKLKG